MMFDKLKKDVWVLASWLFLAEVVLGGVIFGLNYFFDSESYYKLIFNDSFLRYEAFNTILFVLAEIAVILVVVKRWQRKYLRVSRVDRVMEVLDQGEGETVEFKSSLRWDYREGKYNRELEKAVVKSVAGFLNSNGGILVVGVKDSKETLGLQEDFKTLPKANMDSWENHLNQLVKNFLGLEVRRLLGVEFVNLGKKYLAVIEVKKSNRPVYFRDGENELFYVRTGNSTNALSISAATEYIAEHWKKKD